MALQIALAVVLLASATTLMVSQRNVLRVDPGFDASGLLTFDVSLPRSRYDTFARQKQLLDIEIVGVVADTRQESLERRAYAQVYEVASEQSAFWPHGFLAQTVSQRTREIGIRLALGATPGSVVRLIMTTAWLWVGAGAAVGALAASRILRRLVLGLSPTEPVLYAGVVLTLAGLALVAAWIPARRAARVDPVRTLNQA